MKEIGLITKAKELGLCKIIKHPVTGYRVILPPDNEVPDLNDEWEELQTFVNNRRNIKINLKLDGKLKDKIIRDINVCICPECHWQYNSDTPFECENTDCKREGKKGIMCWVIPQKDVISKQNKEMKNE